MREPTSLPAARDTSRDRIVASLADGNAKGLSTLRRDLILRLRLDDAPVPVVEPELLPPQRETTPVV